MAPESNASPGARISLVLETLFRVEEGQREDFFAALDELTHTGTYAPTKKCPEVAFDEETRNELVKSLLLSEERLKSTLVHWFDICDNNAGRALELIKQARVKASEDCSHRHLFPFPSSIRKSDTTDTVPNAERDKKLDELTKFSTLKELFRQDNKGSEAFFTENPLEFLLEVEFEFGTPEAPTSNTNIPGIKGAHKLIDRKEDLDRRKDKLRKEILDLFSIFK